MILKIGKGTFDVRVSVALLTAWARWKIVPSYENLQRLTREIRKQEIRKVPVVRSEEPTKPTLPEARAKTRTPKAPS